MTCRPKPRSKSHSALILAVSLFAPGTVFGQLPAGSTATIEVAGNVLASYVGVYEVAPTFSIEVTLDGGALFMQATNQDRLALFPASEREFLTRAVEASITFLRDGDDDVDGDGEVDVYGDGPVIGLMLEQNGRHLPGRKVR